MDHPISPAAEPPAKRRRLSGSENIMAPEAMDAPSKEQKSGITAFIHPHLPGFSGVLKQRYTDFLVNEILPNGQVLHLQSLVPSRPNRPEAQEQDRMAQRNDKEDENSKRGTREAAKGPAQQDSESMEIGDNNHQPASNDSVEEKEVEEQVKASNGGIDKSSSSHADGAGELEPKDQTPEVITQDQRAILQDILGGEVTNKVVSLYEQRLKEPNRKPREFPTVISEVIKDKDRRTSLHKSIREIFKSKLETMTADDDTISFTAASAAVQARGPGNRSGYHTAPVSRPKQPTWDELGGSYIHFTLYKENKDTMEAVAFLASQLKVQPRSFQFSGTKDRRAVTVQRCSAFRLRAGDLAAMNRKLRNARVGDFQHSPTGLELGDLGGNEFVITLRDCHFPGEEGLDHNGRLKLATKTVSNSVEAFKIGGFLNYFGLQRFGSFATSTDDVGLKLLQGNLEGAVNDILSFNPTALAASEDPSAYPDVSRDDIARAQGINIWFTAHNAQKAIESIPRKFSAESNVIRHLGSRNNTRNDYQGALSSIPRNLRLMYVHAYQSLVWNVIAGKRWELHGHQVVQGDLVLVSEHKDKDPNALASVPTHDEEGEIIVQPAANDRAARPEDDYEKARALTAEEAASGKYTVFDVVLPLPGYDVEYPPNAIGAEYKTFMASERGGGLDPHDMRRSWKDLSLSGGYRKLLARPGEDMAYEVKPYERPEDQLVMTDLERLEKAKMNGRNAGRAEASSYGRTLNGAHASHGENGGATSGGQLENHNLEEKQAEKKVAVILTFKLGPSQYATMALRELMKEGGLQTYKAGFSGGR